MQPQEQQENVFTLPLHEYKDRAYSAVHADVIPQIVKQVGITGQITKVTVIWQTEELTIYPAPSTPVKIPAGDHFDVRIYFTANNPGGGQWEVCGTVLDPSDSSNAHYDFYATGIFGGTGLNGSFYVQDNAATSAPFVMPSRDITLRIRLWGNPYVPNTTPDRSLW